jgi:hypothetical protein
MFAIEFNGKVYRFNKEIFIIDDYGSIREIENPSGKNADVFVIGYGAAKSN